MRSYTKKLTKSTPVYHMSTTSQTRQGSEDPDESETAVQRLQGAKAGQDRQKKGENMVYGGLYICVHVCDAHPNATLRPPALDISYSPARISAFSLAPRTHHARMAHA